MAEEKSASKNILDALKKSGIKVQKTIRVKQTKESKERWAAIDDFCEKVAAANKATEKSTLRFRAAV